MLLLRFPELKDKVSENLQSKNVDKAILETWLKISKQNFQIEEEDEDLTFK